MRISRLTLATIDPEAQAAFWGERLGLSVGWVDEDEVEVRLRDSTIAFRRAAPGLDPRYHFAINLPPGSIGGAVAWLGERHELLGASVEVLLPERYRGHHAEHRHALSDGAHQVDAAPGVLGSARAG